MAKEIIAFDFDDVVCDITRPFLEYNRKFYGIDLSFEVCTSYDLYGELGLTYEEELERWDEFFREGSFCYVAPEDDIISVLNELKKKFRLVIMSNRLKLWQFQAINWIEKYVPNIFDEILFTDSEEYSGKNKAQICREKNISALVEDSDKNINYCLAEGVRVIRFVKPWNTDNPDVESVRSFSELLDLFL